MSAAPSVWRFIRAMAARFPWQLAANTVVLALESVVGLLSFVTVAPVIDVFVDPSLGQASFITVRVVEAMRALHLPVGLGSLLVVFMAFQVLKGGLNILARYGMLRTKLEVLDDLTGGTFDDFLRARWQFFSASRYGTLLNTLLHEITLVGEAFSAMARLFASLLRLACYLALPLWLSWQVTGVSLAAALIFASPFLLLGRLTYRLGAASTEAMNRVSAVAQESMAAAKLILGFSRQQRQAQQLRDAFGRFRRSILRSQTLASGTPLMYEPLGTLVLVVAMLAAQRVGMALSEIAVLLWALRSSIPLIGEAMIQRNNLLNFLPSYEQVCALRQQARDCAEPSGRRPFAGLRKGIELQSVSFAHPGDGPILKDLTMSIPRGKRVAIVGASGAGKSTLLDLLMGFHEPTDGRVLVDGVPLPELDLQAYRCRIGYVPQENFLFHRSIRENLQWALDEATEGAMRQACRRAHADEFIDRLPEGYDTVVGERGVRLSGGQAQRVALARALLRHPDLLILDEATSALDAQSERLIQHALEHVAPGTTVVVVAHRLSTIATADIIYVLHDGRLVEQGTHAELMERKVLEPVS